MGSLSEATEVFEPERLQQIVAELAENLVPVVDDSRLKAIDQAITAVDGSLLKKLPQITQASYLGRKRGPAPNGWKRHTHFEVLRGVPVQMTLTDATGKGEASEKAVLRRKLEADRLYVTDRGYEQFSLFNAIVAAESSYVCRIRNDHHFETQEVRYLSDEAQAIGVVEDLVGKLGSPKSQRIEHPNHPVRLVRVQAAVHPKRGGRHRGAASQEIVLATNLLDVPADVIALLYQHRWTVEIFFRFFKHILGCRHLLSEDPVGIEIQSYMAIIACMLISLWTGRKPTLRTYEMICHYFTGLADEEELLAHIAKLGRHDALPAFLTSSADRG